MAQTNAPKVGGRYTAQKSPVSGIPNESVVEVMHAYDDGAVIVQQWSKVPALVDGGIGQLQTGMTLTIPAKDFAKFEKTRKQIRDTDGDALVGSTETDAQ